MQESCSSSWLIIHTVVSGDTGDGVHVVFVGTDRLAAFVNSFPLKLKKTKTKKKIQDLKLCLNDTSIDTAAANNAHDTQQ